MLGTYLAQAHFLAHRPLPLLTSLPLLPLTSLAHEALLAFLALAFFTFASFVFVTLPFSFLPFLSHPLLELE